MEVWPQMSQTTRLREWAKSLAYDFSRLPMVSKRSSDGYEIAYCKGSIRTDCASASRPYHLQRILQLQQQQQQQQQKMEKSKNQNQNQNQNQNKGIMQKETFWIKGTITAFSYSRDNPPWYKSVPDAQTKAKVVSDGNRHRWLCVHNSKTYLFYEPKYLLVFCLTDSTGSLWVQAFDSVSTALLHVRASVAEQYLLSNHSSSSSSSPHGSSAFEHIFNQACFQTKLFQLSLQSIPLSLQTQTQTQTQSQSRPNSHFVVVRVRNIDFKAECQYLLRKIDQLERFLSLF
ncbi:hypothetical protein RFI_18592 [Reticulomyxa filosa]|uniref:Replication factor A C-terminal domain-containing protein n=1 Tax=Reticulomyxa filosa TaxID=46433 RepID=X6MXB6_RETFI|nr:hypothetical protein RFI_18592 [Reticulomyxa filosa]|eukprot:ETO18670.1 hypothetical protein RFI_18592 [Reticulomyxa filosa]